jgi:hypothetical protein
MAMNIAEIDESEYEILDDLPLMERVVWFHADTDELYFALYDNVLDEF